MKTFAILVIFCSFFFFAKGQNINLPKTACPTYWVDATSVDMGCLWFDFKSSVYWNYAQDFCQHLNTTSLTRAHLVEVLSLQQQEFLEFKFIEFDVVFGISKNWWIGLTDDLTEGRWLWSNSLVPSNYTNWYTGRPTEDINVNYVGIPYDPKYEYTWLDLAINTKYNAICQFFPSIN